MRYRQIGSLMLVDCVVDVMNYYIFRIFANLFVNMDALIKISSSEFNEDLFKKIKSLLKSAGNAEITISVNDTGHSRKESKEEYWARLDTSASEIKKGNGIVFSMKELDEYIHNNA